MSKCELDCLVDAWAGCYARTSVLDPYLGDQSAYWYGRDHSCWYEVMEALGKERADLIKTQIRERDNERRAARLQRA
jgi:hypothetical protein